MRIMDKKDLRIVYMGTPAFAVESLRRLIEGGYNVVGVVTMPDKPVGRHQTDLQASPVKQYAMQHGLRVLQPVKLKDASFLDELKDLKADLQIVVAFRMLPEVVWAMPRLGTFNLHASLLPQYRGAAPINWALINGETETGLTTFFLKHEIDVGDVIQQEKVPIYETDDAGILHDRLMMKGGELVIETVDRILAGPVQTVPQTAIAVSAKLRPAPKIFRDTCRIDWGTSAKKVYDFVRGLSPHPAAWTLLTDASGNERVLKVYRVSCCVASHGLSVGKLRISGQNLLQVAAPGGFVTLEEVQLAGKKKMAAADFLRGFHSLDDCYVR